MVKNQMFHLLLVIRQPKFKMVPQPSNKVQRFPGYEHNSQLARPITVKHTTLPYQKGEDRGPCMLNMKSGMVDGMLVGMLLGAIYGAVQVYRTQEAPNTQKAAIDIADWSVHVAVVCALVGALIALAKGI